MASTGQPPGGAAGGVDPDDGNDGGHTGGIGGHLTYVSHLEAPDTVVAMVNSLEADVFGVAEAAWLPALGVESSIFPVR